MDHHKLGGVGAGVGESVLNSTIKTAFLVLRLRHEEGAVALPSRSAAESAHPAERPARRSPSALSSAPRAPSLTHLLFLFFFFPLSPFFLFYPCAPVPVI